MGMVPTINIALPPAVGGAPGPVSVDASLVPLPSPPLPVLPPVLVPLLPPVSLDMPPVLALPPVLLLPPALDELPPVLLPPDPLGELPPVLPPPPEPTVAGGDPPEPAVAGVSWWAQAETASVAISTAGQTRIPRF
jgi:hypothetical protein